MARQTGNGDSLIRIRSAKKTIFKSGHVTVVVIINWRVRRRHNHISAPPAPHYHPTSVSGPGSITAFISRARCQAAQRAAAVPSPSFTFSYPTATAALAAAPSGQKRYCAALAYLLSRYSVPHRYVRRRPPKTTTAGVWSSAAVSPVTWHVIVLSRGRRSSRAANHRSRYTRSTHESCRCRRSSRRVAVASLTSVIGRLRVPIRT